MRDVGLMQLIRMKGRAQPELLAEAYRCDVEQLTPHLDVLTDAGLLERTNVGFKLSRQGEHELARHLATERVALDVDLVDALYEDFCELDGEVKQIVTAWQLTDGRLTINDHSDAEYDGRVVRDLIRFHVTAAPLFGRAASLVPRLSSYAPRFERAVGKIAAGLHNYIAAPLMDSYHTLWFELHEELIGLVGRTRDTEAQAGRA